ncbi:RNA 2'-phosphotransferase [Spirosoma harenae]
MISEQETTRISKRLSLILRHRPESIGILLDENGWTDVAILLNKLAISKAILSHVVATNNKKRFAFNADETKIRANQGHSVDIDLGYQTQEPPKVLYHGTGQNSVQSILKTGLQKQKRHHVHLSADIETALNVGKRHGVPVVLEVNTEQMQNDSFAFYQSTNGVWLTDHVPVKYIKELTTN